MIAMIDKVFGRLTVVKEQAAQRPCGQWLCRCECECGAVKFVGGADLRAGKVLSCGCYNRDKLKERRIPIDMTGQRFGRWVVTGGRVDGDAYKCPCVCDCGSIKNVSIVSLKEGRSQSCGCLRSELLTEDNFKHGGAYTFEYCIWGGMKARCSNSSAPQYKDYGGRGITVCERWLESYGNFIKDMGNRPSSAHTLDRIDNNGDYCPENCRWTTREEQNNNKRNNVFLRAYGKTLTLSQWSREVGLSASAISARVLRGLTGPLALAPTHRCKSYVGPLCVKHLDNYTSEEIKEFCNAN